MQYRFLTSDVPPTARREALRVAASGVFGLDVRLGHGPEVQCEIMAGRFGPLRIASFVTGPGQVVNVAPQNHDSLSVLALARGEAIADAGGTQARVRPGRMCVIDTSRAFRWIHESHRVVVVDVPRATFPLAKRLGDIAGPIVPDDGFTPIVTGLAHELADQLAKGDQANGIKIGSALLDVLTVAISEHLGSSGELPPEPRWRALRSQVLDFIERNLGDQYLDPAGVAAAHHISVRYLYRLLEDIDEHGVSPAEYRRRALDMPAG